MRGQIVPYGSLQEKEECSDRPLKGVHGFDFVAIAFKHARLESHSLHFRVTLARIYLHQNQQADRFSLAMRDEKDI